ncbi:MAG: IS200/IS605 family transposase [Zavarzinella sp.]
MSQTYSLVYIHVVFSTKDRFPFLHSEIRARVHAYLATIARQHGCAPVEVGGMADHVHLAIRLSRTITIAKLVEELKTDSSKWIKTLSPTMDKFSWQRGYGCFSVGPADIQNLQKYIQEQEVHHKTKTFQDEFLRFCTKYGIELNEAFIQD